MEHVRVRGARVRSSGARKCGGGAGDVEGTADGAVDHAAALQKLGYMVHAYALEGNDAVALVDYDTLMLSANRGQGWREIALKTLININHYKNDILLSLLRSCKYPRFSLFKYLLRFKLRGIEKNQRQQP